jgi:SAM-dependent methyltransferase
MVSPGQAGRPAQGAESLRRAPVPRVSNPIQPSTRAYVSSPEIARDYDTYFADTELFQYDCELLRRWMPAPGRLIDLGCGSGRHLVMFARAGFDGTGVDLSKHMLSVASAKLKRLGLAARLVEGDIVASADRFEPGSFDYALCMFSTFGLIAGSKNRRHALRDWRRLLKPGGRLALHVHNRWHNLLSLEGWAYLISNALRVLIGRGEWGDKYISRYRGIRDMYVHVFSRREIFSLLHEACFEVIDCVDLNQSRSGPLRRDWARGVFANGFVLLARSATDPPTGGAG